MHRWSNRLILFIKDQRGVTLVEYALALTLMLAIGVAALATLASDVGGSVGKASTELKK
ncbi:Flp family type IVb pilin [Vannielia litorea]|nr:Flp family type IVb pilin [Vannielia litorea]